MDGLVGVLLRVEAIGCAIDVAVIVNLYLLVKFSSPLEGRGDSFAKVEDKLGLGSLVSISDCLGYSHHFILSFFSPEVAKLKSISVEVFDGGFVEGHGGLFELGGLFLSKD